MTIDNKAVEKASLDGDEAPVLRGAVEEPPMESLTHLVSESLARNGYETSLDHRRLEWSKWFRCESSFSVLLAPSKPGLFALGEEIIAPGETAATGGKRMLALFRIAEAEDLGMALGHLFLPGNPEREKLSAGHCFVRYAVIEDAAQRQSAHLALQHMDGDIVRNGFRRVHYAQFPVNQSAGSEERIRNARKRNSRSRN
jgi:hypothetical protein